MAKQLNSAELLAGWIEEEDLLFRITEKEAELILGYLEGSGYSLIAEEGKLYQCDDVNETREQTAIDDVVDFVCEQNYILMEQTTEKIGNSDIHEDTRQEEAYLCSLLDDQDILDTIFSRTRYQKEMDQRIQTVSGKAIPVVAVR
jgi:hypothetical protein